MKAPTPDLGVSEALFTLVPMAFHMGKTLLRGGVTRNLRLRPALSELTPFSTVTAQLCGVASRLGLAEGGGEGWRAR